MQQLSQHTLAVLQNFVGINPSLVIRKTPEGENKSTIHTIDADKQIYGNAVVDDIFNTNICLYDLKAFLSVVESFGDKAVVDFKDTHVEIEGEGSKTKIVYADSTVITHPEHTLSKAQGNFEFKLSASTFDKVMSMGNILTLPHFRIFSKDGDLLIQAEDKRNANTNSFAVKVGTATQDCSVYIKRENMKMKRGDYQVNVTDNMAIFQHEVDSNLYYCIALDLSE